MAVDWSKVKDREFYRATSGVWGAGTPLRSVGRSAPRPDRRPGAPDPATERLPIAVARSLESPRGRR